MPVPYGFGVGDFITVGTLAWTVYKSCKAAPESFKNIHLEVLSLQALTKEAEETVFKTPLTPERQARLAVVKDGCMAVLTDLDALVQKYESLGTKSKRTWDRMRWGNEDVDEIRARLNTHVTMLAAFISTSQVSVEQKLDKFLQDFRQGKRENSVISVQTIDSLTKDDRAMWRNIRKELEDVGITLDAWQTNHGFIMNWFVRMTETGAFKEEAVPDSSETTGDISPAFEQASIPSQLTALEVKAPTADQQNANGLEGPHFDAQFFGGLILLEEPFMYFIDAMRARSGYIEESLSPLAQQAVRDESSVKRLYDSMIREPFKTERAAAVSVEVLFAAFDLFISNAWENRMGPLIGKDTLRDMQAKFDIISENWGLIFTRYLEDIAPLKQKCLVATVKLHRQLCNASVNVRERDYIDSYFAKILLSCDEPLGHSTGQGHEHSRLLYLFENFLEELDTRSADVDTSKALSLTLLAFEDLPRKHNEPSKQQTTATSFPSESTDLEILPQRVSPFWNTVLPIISDNLTTNPPQNDLAIATRKPALGSIALSTITNGLPSFSQPKDELLAAASEFDGATTVGAILEEHQLGKDVLSSALVIASRAGVLDSMAMLVNKGANVNFHEIARTPLSAAVSSKNEPAVLFLLAQGAEVNYQDGLLPHALYIAADISCIPLMRILVKAGATLPPVSLPQLHHPYMLFDMIKYSTIEAVHLLIQAGADVNNPFHVKGTPLMYALKLRKVDVVKLLVDNGADVRQHCTEKTPEGCVDPLEAAVVANRFSQVEILLRHGALKTRVEARRMLKFAQANLTKMLSSAILPDEVHRHHFIIRFIENQEMQLPES